MLDEKRNRPETRGRKPYGYIYRVTHPREKGCYIGRTRVSLGERWRAHKRQAGDAFKRRSDEIQRSDGKLHERIAINRATIDQFVVGRLAVAYSKLELVQLEHDHIMRHDSIKSGWNIVLPNPDDCIEDLDAGETHLIDGNEFKADSFSDLCRQNRVAYSSAMYWRKKGKSIEESILRVRENQCRPGKAYIIYRQKFKSILDLSKSRFNKHKIRSKTLERRIRVAIRDGDLETQYDQVGNVVGININPSILEEAPRKRPTYEVQTPDGICGPALIKELHARLAAKYPKTVRGYTTVQSRLTNLGWTTEQAFGFAAPPNFTLADEFVQNRGYSYVPPLIPGEMLDANTTPVILHETSEVFQSHRIFSEAYGLKEDQVSDRFAEGLTAVQVLGYYELKPS
jgi:hypothetical protein